MIEVFNECTWVEYVDEVEDWFWFSVEFIDLTFEESTGGGDGSLLGGPVPSSFRRCFLL